MHRKSVTSSNLVSVGYDAESKALQIEFDGGAVYDYEDVPAEVHEELMSASSHGKYFDRRIKHSYAYSRVR